jgi:diguanylate cyclase (GGDEF)-like protein/PAS domain S-box-containing protein
MPALSTAPAPTARPLVAARPDASPPDRLALVIEAQHAIAEAGLDLDAVLALVLERAARLTGADAAVIEMVDGADPGTLVYRAASGRAAPFVGLRLAVGTSLSGRCVRMGMPLRCDDAEDDPRVDREACRRVGARSMLVVPLRHGGAVIGVVKVTSPEPRVFDDDDAGALGLLAGMIAAALHNADAFRAAQALAEERATALAVLHESEERFRSAFAHAGIGMALVGLDGRWLRVNHALCRITGYDAEALAARTFQDITHPDDLEADLSLVTQLLAGEIASYELEKRYLHRDGHAVPILLTGSVVRDAAGRPLHFIAQVQDVSARKAAEAAQARLSAIVESMPDMVAICEPDGRITYLNASGRRLLGFGDVQPAGLITVADVQPQFAPGGALADAVATMRRDGTWRGETTLRRADGRLLPVEQILLAHAPEPGAPTSISAILRDLSERKHTEATLRSLALTDELTTLYNRRGFVALAEEELRRARADGWPVLLFYGDLDAFKGINDVHGHAEGDRALQDVAALLRGVFRESDIVGRIGGDEFTALVPHGRPETEAMVRARIAHRFAEFNATAGRPYPLSLSLGSAMCTPESPRDLDALFAEADAALLARKRARRAS